MIVSRLGDLQLSISVSDLRLADRFINDANDVSGDIVLRAAQRGTSASELIGLVLSQYIVRYELGACQHRVVLPRRLRDWLGQKEHIADLLALSPRTAPDGSIAARNRDRGEVHRCHQLGGKA